MQYFKTQQKPHGCLTDEHAGFQSQKNDMLLKHNTMLTKHYLLVTQVLKQSLTYLIGFMLLYVE